MKEGLYEQVINEDILYELKTLNNDEFIIDKLKMDKEEARAILTTYISSVIRKGLDYVRDKSKDEKDEKLLKQIELCNKIIHTISEYSQENDINGFKINESGEMLMALYSKINNSIALKKSHKDIVRPVTPLSQSSLFTGATMEPDMLSELKKEIITSDAIDFLVSFIKWSGIRCILDELKEFTTKKNKKLRIITTSYMGATDVKAIEELAKLPNTEIKISYDTKRTRLHAKAYMFYRETEFTTAYIGSSNISNAALTSGLEWNLKITEKDSFDIVKKFEATFESYWNDSEFTLFTNSDENKKILREALEGEFNKDSSETSFFMDIRPYSYQKEVLESLKAEREIFNRYKNLVVAATGVGKTVISAFDYKNFILKNKEKANRLLFVAHREEILKQSRDTFRAILRDNNFGELMVGSNIPNSLDYLFVSIQSLNSKDLTSITSKDFYDFIIIDEFHHAAAPSYQKLLSYYEPKILLGLTATPERNDRGDVFKYFEGRISVEIRLNEAIDRKLLSPFQYFAVTDSIDLSKLKWSRKGYDIRELDNLYTNNDIRSSHILESVNKYVTNIKEVVGLGFCVSVEHAKYMANFFTNYGVESIALHGKSTVEERNTAKERLVKGNIRFIFVVDLYNEGVDIPQVNTILFLRPTESLTVFLQQLGRGLRLSDNKDCLTVLDFVGQAHKNYNFEEKFRSISGASNHSIKYCLENGFIHLPKGCYIQLEKQAKEYVLRNLKESANNKNNLINKLKTFTSDTSLELTLENFLKYHHLTLIELYGKLGNRNFSRMCVDAGVLKDFKDKNEMEITKKLKNLFHLNSRRLIKFIVSIINIKNFDFNEEERLMANMLYYTFYNNNPEKEGFKSIREALEELFNNQVMMKEVAEILKFNYNNLHFIDKEVSLGFNCPLDLHCNYTRDQIMAAFGYFNEYKKPAFREGVKYFEDKKLDAFFITLNKSDKDFSPSTLYEDYAINEELFHWQSQSTTSVESKTGQRYIHHKQTANKILLFIRESKNKDGITATFTYLGLCEYKSHSGNKPISFTWKLKEPIPANMIKLANKSIII